MTRRSQDRFLPLGLAAALLALGACSGDTNLVRDAAVATGVGVEPKPAPDFVASSRPGEVDYIRPGVATRTGVAKTAAQVQVFETDMNNVRAANESRAAAARDLASGSPPTPAAPPKR